MSDVAEITLETILAKLRALAPAIQAEGVTRLAVFGSRVRGDARPDSDLDILVEHGPRENGRPSFNLFKVMNLIEDEVGVWPPIMTDEELTPRIRERMADDLRGVLMPPSAEDRLNDIHHAILELETFLRDTDADQFAANRGLHLISERLLEIICEAARHLPEHVKMEGPDINWRLVVDFGNRLRHACQSTKTDIVWGIIQDHIPPLKAFVESQIRE